MSRQISDLEAILQGLIAEHRKLLRQVEAHEAAMRKLDLKAMEDAHAQQEASRLRLGVWETKRKTVIAQIAKSMRVAESGLTLTKLAALFPPRREALLKLRDELKELAQDVSGRTHVAGRIAGAVLGHLNTAVRLFAGAVGKAGLYTKHGIPQVSRRIGVMEAVG